jgi:hypothetical protein
MKVPASILRKYRVCAEHIEIPLKKQTKAIAMIIPPGGGGGGGGGWGGGGGGGGGASGGLKATMGVAYN